jgi:ferric-dicitrate binding protein FerR (iron transport regulator)
MGKAIRVEGCAMAPMVEADRDRRLDAREQASLRRHLSTCASCRRLAADLASLGDLATRRALPETTPLDRQRGRAALLRRAAIDQSSPASPTAPRIGRVAAAAIVVLAAGAVVRQTGQHGGHPGGREGAIALARKMPPVPRVAVVSDETTVTGAPGVRFTRIKADGIERVDLEDGAIDLHVLPLGPAQRFLVATGDAEVEVRGTEFHVEAKRRHLVSVSVREGKVEVRYAGSFVTMVEAGQSFVPEADAGLTGEPAPPVEQAPPPAGDKGLTRAPGPQPPLLLPARELPPVRSSEPAARPGGHPHTPGGTDNGAALLAEGVRLIERGDYAAAAERLGAYQRERPADPRAEDAAFLTILALQRAGRRDEARAAAKQYLEKYPSAYHRADAEKLAR